MAQHPHADLIMAYAKIAQTTDKPWKHFQVQVSGGIWVGAAGGGAAFSRRVCLSPQTCPHHPHRQVRCAGACEGAAGLWSGVLHT